MKIKTRCPDKHYDIDVICTPAVRWPSIRQMMDSSTTEIVEVSLVEVEFHQDGEIVESWIFADTKAAADWVDSRIDGGEYTGPLPIQDERFVGCYIDFDGRIKFALDGGELLRDG